jgi:hypothetical protein
MPDTILNPLYGGLAAGDHYRAVRLQMEDRIKNSSVGTAPSVTWRPDAPPDQRVTPAPELSRRSRPSVMFFPFSLKI